jgi:hypothetical protein
MQVERKRWIARRTMRMVVALPPGIWRLADPSSEDQLAPFHPATGAGT